MIVCGNKRKFWLKIELMGIIILNIGGDKMKLPRYSYNSAKQIIESNIGKDVDFVSKVARGKTVKNNGRIQNAYKNIFTISTKSDDKENVISFSYCDIINHSLLLNIK